MTPIGQISYDAVMDYIAPRLADGFHSVDLSPLFRLVTPENYAANIPAIVDAIVAETRTRLAVDASIEELREILETAVAPKLGYDSRRAGPARFSNDPRPRESFLDRFPEARRIKQADCFSGRQEPPAPAVVNLDTRKRFPEMRKMKIV
ncbi:hypothetical protein [Methylocystis sp.]|uniref:hypothetical protein n=1 Tax=Methylocystis sp. TaxID=1911079 RepID=UPI0025DFDDED|nr:hypothetical protein [Methylocystis sp.]